MKTITKEHAVRIFVAACMEQVMNPFKDLGTIVYNYLPVELSSTINSTPLSMFGLTDAEQVKVMLFNLTDGEM